MEVYIVHHPILVDRKKFLLESLQKNNIEGLWIEGFYPNEIALPPDKGEITLKEYSLYLKHDAALKTFLQKNKTDICLILEDDALLPLNFLEYLNICLKEFFELQGDILMLGTAFDYKPSSIMPNKHVYFNPSFTTRCTHAILYNKKAAELVANDLQFNPKPYDHKLNEIIIKNKLRTCWVEPGLYQGSRPDTPTTHLWHTSIR